MSLDKLNSQYAKTINTLLDKLFPSAEPDNDLHSLQNAVRYAALSPGKRLRPLLVYAAGRALGVNDALLEQPALAVELIHCYSLIHDDLPAMDDDDLRRGQPTVHRAFNEASAILAGDSLQAQAFNLLANQTGVATSCISQSLQIISKAALDMVKGQSLDLAFEGYSPSKDELEQMLQLKTGALIRASVLLPTVYVENLPESQCQALAEFAEAIGLAFQIRDDVLDITGDTEVLGKPQGSDAGLDKAAWPAQFGIEEAHVRVGQLYERAIISLKHFGDSADLLRYLAERMIQRDY